MDRLLSSFQDGGWGMWFVLVFGVLSMTGAGRFAWRGEHRLTAFMRWMTLTTLASAVFGFITGMMKVFAYIVEQAKPDERTLILYQGTREASNTLAFGLMLTTITCLLAAIGHRRFPLEP